MCPNQKWKKKVKFPLFFYINVPKSKMDILKMSNSIFFDFRLEKIKKSLFKVFYFCYVKCSQSENMLFLGYFSLSSFLIYINY